MLRELTIENLAVIEKAQAHFGGSFNVFTGETGAGKSVLIGGINAILGQRTTKDIVRTGTQRASVTALFDDIPAAAAAKLAELGIEAPDGELLLSREITADGKSTARINGRTATAAMLREIGCLLVDVHGQHENRILMSNDAQREILDSYAGLGAELEEYRTSFRAFSAVSRRVKQLKAQDETRALRMEHLAAVIEELSALDLEKGDGDRLEAELERLRSAAKVRQGLFGAYASLDPEDAPGALELLRLAQGQLQGISAAEPAAQELALRLEELIPEAEDIAAEVASLMGGEDSEQREEALADRVSALKSARRRYGMESDELVDYLDKCRGELQELDGADDELEELSAQRHALAEQVKAAAADISRRRSEAAQKLSAQICEELRFLDMPNVRIIISVTPEKITVNGMDAVEILISANAGEEPKPLGKTASGGELSRVMLAIKSVLAECDDIPTLIFDEVDAGISGRAAQKVGIKLQQTARRRQVLCITHLAQIASRADCHLLIEKQTEGGRTYTHIEQLDHDGRTRELARIIDGSGMSESSLKAAEEMLKAAQNNG